MLTYVVFSTHRCQEWGGHTEDGLWFLTEILEESRMIGSQTQMCSWIHGGICYNADPQAVLRETVFPWTRCGSWESHSPGYHRSYHSKRNHLKRTPGWTTDLAHLNILPPLFASSHLKLLTDVNTKKWNQSRSVVPQGWFVCLFVVFSLTGL